MNPTEDDHAPADWVEYLDRPVEALWVLGGDGRNVLDASGLNSYGCAPTVRPNVVAFGSCTSSSPTRRSMSAAEEARLELLLAARDGMFEPVADAMMNEIRESLRQQLGIQGIDDLGIMLTPSGTDAEYVPLLVAAAGHDRPICNIVLGPNEVGGGTLRAAEGRYFNELTPSGARRPVGTPLAADVPSRVRVDSVGLRDGEGALLDPDVLDAHAEALVDDAIQRGESVIIHAVAHSKTGVHAPTPAALRRLRSRHGDRVFVVVDAAQGRVSRRGLRDVLEDGWIVLFTGSKFYGGPPFSGSVLVPNASRFSPDWIPAGVADFFDRSAVPHGWARLREALPSTPNVGLMLRWWAALAEFRAYYSAPARIRLEVMRVFEKRVPDLLGKAAHVDISYVPVPRISNDEHRVLESKTTVFAFGVRDPSGRRLTLDELWTVHRLLNSDVSRRLPAEATEEERSIAAAEFHLGQPVRLGKGGATEPSVLRIALGGPLITRVTADPRIGRTLDERLAWLEAQITGVGRKIDVLTRYGDALRAPPP